MSTHIKAAAKDGVLSKYPQKINVKNKKSMLNEGDITCLLGETRAFSPDVKLVKVLTMMF